VKPLRLQEITSRYPALKIGVVGDISLDRYFEIDPVLEETSIETNLPVHNVTRVRCQAGAAGTILNNLSALGIGSIQPVAIIGQDGEGYELRRALEKLNGIELSGIIESSQRATFTYSKPLLMHQGKPPQELNRLDIKNWTPTPEVLQGQVIEQMRRVAQTVDALILLDQVDLPDTGVITKRVLESVREITSDRPDLLILADSRRSLRGYPKVSLKMNGSELASLIGSNAPLSHAEVMENALMLSEEYGKYVFITRAAEGMVGAYKRDVERVVSLPLRGAIDIVGAGDAVTANLAAAIGGGAGLKECLELAQLASSIVIHQLGTTGTASVKELAELLVNSPFLEE
jgi:rfaE bifunctional protein kinase chain/domain